MSRFTFALHRVSERVKSLLTSLDPMEVSIWTSDRTFYDDANTGLPWLIIWSPVFDKLHLAWLAFHEGTCDEQERQDHPEVWERGRENLTKLARGELVTPAEAQEFVRFALTVCISMDVISKGWFCLATYIHLLIQQGLLRQGPNKRGLKKYYYALYRSEQAPEAITGGMTTLHLNFADLLV